MAAAAARGSEAEAARLLGGGASPGSDDEPSPAGPGSGGDDLRRDLSSCDAVAIVVSVIVGSGIFASPGVILSTCGSVGLGLLAWLIAGVLATASSLVYCELGAMLPLAGGDYDYLRAAFGEGVAFSWAFVTFFVQKPASLAIVSMVVGNYFLTSLLGADDSTIAGESSIRVKIFATAYVVVLTAINVLPIGCESRDYCCMVSGLHSSKESQQ
eukprot:COSAG04_NODE_3605_length_2676_cov_1.456345_1_plen_213_part_00